MIQIHRTKHGVWHLANDRAPNVMWISYKSYNLKHLLFFKVISGKVFEVKTTLGGEAKLNSSEKMPQIVLNKALQTTVA